MQSGSLKLLLLFFVFLLLPACGGGGGGSSSSGSSSGNSGSQPSGTNVLAVTVNGSTCDSSINAGYVNDPCVSVTVCTPGTSNCVAINSILLDTGSYGLRIFKQALGSVSLMQVTSGSSGSGSLAECIQFADNTSDWGPVQMASVTLGNEPAVQIPIQVIDSTFGTVPSSCGTPVTQPSVAEFNGILGVGPFIRDCGPTCVTSIPNPAIYYSCSGSTCTATTVPLNNQVQNPVAALPLDNNGVIVQLPSVAAGGASSVTGSLVLGINTQTNNVPSGVTTYSLNQNGDFVTIFNNSTFTPEASNPLSGSFIDTGSNGLFFPSPSSSSPDAGELPICPLNSGFFCPSSTAGFSATIEGTSGSPTGTVSFQIGNFNTLISSPNKVFNDIGGNMSGTFDWGLPFYFGRNVYIGFESSKNPGTGQYFAF